MKVYKNIDVVQINIKAGVREYFLPKNVDWADKVIDKIVLYTSGTKFSNTTEISPVDFSTPILNRKKIEDLYFDFYASDGSEIATSLSAIQILHTNNEPVEINNELSLLLSKLFFATTPVDDGCLLLYVFYGSSEVEEHASQKSVTVETILKESSEIVMSDIIDSYVHSQGAKIKGIYFWGDKFDKPISNGVFLTLRDRNYRTIIKHLPVIMCMPPMGDQYWDITPVFWYDRAEYIQTNPLFLSDEDVDFANSIIENTGSETSVKLTFLY